MNQGFGQNIHFIIYHNSLLQCNNLFQIMILTIVKLCLPVSFSCNQLHGKISFTKISLHENVYPLQVNSMINLIMRQILSHANLLVHHIFSLFFLRFVSLFRHEKHPTMSGTKTDMWTTMHSFVGRGKGVSIQFCFYWSNL